MEYKVIQADSGAHLERELNASGEGWELHSVQVTSSPDGQGSFFVIIIAVLERSQNYDDPVTVV